MLVGIESHFGDGVISGKECTKKELKKRMKKVLELIEKTEDFTLLFCRMYNFEQLPYSEDMIRQTEVKFTIDLDTYLILPLNNRD